MNDLTNLQNGSGHYIGKVKNVPKEKHKKFYFARAESYIIYQKEKIGWVHKQLEIFAWNIL